MTTETSIRARLAIDDAKPSRLASWEDVRFLLNLADHLRQGRKVCWCSNGEKCTINPKVEA